MAVVDNAQTKPDLSGPTAGKSVDSPRRDIMIGVIVVSLFFGGFFGWAAIVPLDAAAVASGVVQVTGNRKAVQHQQGGTVERILVSSGDRVQQGDLLLELDTEELEGTRRQLQSRLITLRAREARLLAEQAGLDEIQPGEWLSGLSGEAAEDAAEALQSEQNQLDTRAESLVGQIDVLTQRKVQLEQRIAGFQAQLRSNAQQTDLIEDQLADTQELYDKGLSPLTRVRQLQTQLASLEGERGRLISSVAEARENMGEVDMQISSLQDELNTDVATRLSAAQREIAEVQPQYDTVALRIERSEVRAPVDGIVVNMTVFTEGGVISPGQVLMEIVPVDQPLVVKARVDPANADDVEIGMEAQVRLEIARSRENPILYGEVTQLSADRLIDERTGVPYFDAEVVVSADELERIEEFVGPITLRPGMPAQVVIPLHARTALGYIFEPITGMLWRAGREI